MPKKQQPKPGARHQPDSRLAATRNDSDERTLTSARRLDSEVTKPNGRRYEPENSVTDPRRMVADFDAEWTAPGVRRSRQQESDADLMSVLVAHAVPDDPRLEKARSRFMSDSLDIEVTQPSKVKLR